MKRCNPDVLKRYSAISNQKHEEKKIWRSKRYQGNKVVKNDANNHADKKSICFKELQNFIKHKYFVFIKFAANLIIFAVYIQQLSFIF